MIAEWAREPGNEVCDLLCRLNMPTKLLGYKYAALAVQIVLDDNEAGFSISGKLFPHIAEVYSTSVDCVEYAIRSAIIKSWQSADALKLQSEIFSGTVSFKRGRPSTCEYILLISKYIRKKRLGLL